MPTAFPPGVGGGGGGGGGANVPTHPTPKFEVPLVGSTYEI